MSSAQPSFRSIGSTDSPITLTPRRSNSGLIFAIVPSSVVQTGVKSLGCEKSTAHESPIQSWKRMRPSVVSASKSGASLPSWSRAAVAGSWLVVVIRSSCRYRFAPLACTSSVTKR